MNEPAPPSTCPVIDAPLDILVGIIHEDSPFEIFSWDPEDEPLTREEIEAAITAGNLNSKHFSDPLTGWPRQLHVERVAYLVVHPSDDPVDLDMGTQGSPASLIDGYHRLASAIYRKAPSIKAMLSGDLDYAEEAFDIKIP